MVLFKTYLRGYQPPLARPHAHLYAAGRSLQYAVRRFGFLRASMQEAQREGVTCTHNHAHGRKVSLIPFCQITAYVRREEERERYDKQRNKREKEGPGEERRGEKSLFE